MRDKGTRLTPRGDGLSSRLGANFISERDELRDELDVNGKLYPPNPPALQSLPGLDPEGLEANPGRMGGSGALWLFLRARIIQSL